jgi:hypothetical protein
MGTIVTTPESCREIIARAGGDPSLSTYDYETSTLDAPDLTDRQLSDSQAAIAGRSAPATIEDKRRKDREKQIEAFARRDAAFLAGDTQYQTDLSAITAATTLADLDAI